MDGLKSGPEVARIYQAATNLPNLSMRPTFQPIKAETGAFEAKVHLTPSHYLIVDDDVVEGEVLEEAVLGGRRVRPLSVQRAVHRRPRAEAQVEPDRLATGPRKDFLEVVDVPGKRFKF